MTRKSCGDRCAAATEAPRRHGDLQVICIGWHLARGEETRQENGSSVKGCGGPAGSAASQACVCVHPGPSPVLGTVHRAYPIMLLSLSTNISRRDAGRGEETDKGAGLLDTANRRACIVSPRRAPRISSSRCQQQGWLRGPWWCGTVAGASMMMMITVGTGPVSPRPSI